MSTGYRFGLLGAMLTVVFGGAALDCFAFSASPQQWGVGAFTGLLATIIAFLQEKLQ